MELPKLKEVLDARQLLAEEKKMWLRVGLYITSEAIEKVFYKDNGTREWRKVVILFDGCGNETCISQVMGNNIRRTVLDWWQVEKTKPRLKEAEYDPTGLSALENRSA